MIIAPHPDDDVIAAGGLIQQVVATGGNLRIVYVTDGENNPWPQRAMERRLVIREPDRRRWGAMRRREALAALGQLAPGRDVAQFLAFPDHGIASLLLADDRRLESELRAALKDFAPTLVIMPSHYDLHPDHRAIAAFACRALEGSSGTPEVRTYVIHGPAARARVENVVHLSDLERERKTSAILCHRSQLYLSRSRFLAHARGSEKFSRAEIDAPVRATRTSFLLASLGHAASLLWRAGQQPVEPVTAPPAGEGVDYDPATRHA